MTALASASHDTTETAWGRYCTIRSRPLARGVLAALVGIAVAGGTWLIATMLAGPWLADSLVVEGLVAGTVLLAGVLLALMLSRALGCGHCHTPACTCS